MAPLMLIQCGSPTLPCCCARRYENAVVCICLRCAPFTLEWKPTCTHQHLASVTRGKRPQSAFICESTDPAGVHRYLWTPAAISCDGNMTLGGADWTRLLLLLYCDVGVLKSRTLALLFIVHRTFLHKLFLNIAPSVNHSKKKMSPPFHYLLVKAMQSLQHCIWSSSTQTYAFAVFSWRGKWGFKISNFLVSVSAGALAGGIDCCLSRPVSLDF